MHSAFNLLFFPNFMFAQFFDLRTMCSGEISLENNHYYHYFMCDSIASRCRQCLDQNGRQFENRR